MATWRPSAQGGLQARCCYTVRTALVARVLSDASKKEAKAQQTREQGSRRIGGDFNAETEAFLRGRGKKERTLSDRMFNSMLTEAGRDLRAMANDATYRAGTQIDNWIVTPAPANVMGRVHIMPGVCGKDHDA